MLMSASGVYGFRTLQECFIPCASIILPHRCGDASSLALRNLGVLLVAS